MLINFDKPVKQIDGADMQRDGKAVLMKDVVLDVLAADDRDAPDGTADEKISRAKLEYLVHGGGDLELTVEALATIKTLIGKYGIPIVVMQIYSHIEGE